MGGNVSFVLAGSNCHVMLNKINIENLCVKTLKSANVVDFIFHFPYTLANRFLIYNYQNECKFIELASV